MNERGKGRDTENYDETGKMGLPFFIFLFFTPCYFFVLLFLLSIWAARSDRGEKCPKGYERGRKLSSRHLSRT